MSTESLTKLVNDFVELVRFHELAEVDSQAASLLLRASSYIEPSVGDREEVDENLDDWIAEVEAANTHEMT